MSPPTPRQLLADFGGVYLANGLVAFLFAASGPVAIILAVGGQGGLTPSDLSSWIFGAFFVNGLISIGFCLWYRQPLVFFWTIPGAVLVTAGLSSLVYAIVKAGTDGWLAGPTVAYVAPHEDPPVGTPEGNVEGRFTGPYNLAGLPAVSVPCGRAECDLPAGLQLAGPAGADALVLSLASEFERLSS